MTIVAANSLMDVNAVVEKDVVRQVVRADPSQRHARSVTLPYWAQHCAVGPHLGMTIHARLRWRDACKAGIFYRSVAITAVQPKSANMVFMAERHGLWMNNSAIGVVSGALHHLEKPDQRHRRYDATKKEEPVQGIRIRMKELTHVPGGSRRSRVTVSH